MELVFLRKWWAVVSSLLWGLWMPSVLGLREQRELAARRRVDVLREEVDRIQAELSVAELEWKEWAVARSRVGEVLDPVDETGQEHVPAVPASAAAARPKSQVPMWREGLAWSVLSANYQRIVQIASRLGCPEMCTVSRGLSVHSGP